MRLRSMRPGAIENNRTSVVYKARYKFSERFDAQVLTSPKVDQGRVLCA